MRTVIGTVTGVCPVWCRTDISADDRVMHLGEDRITGDASVRVERLDGDAAVVRVETSGEPMAPLEALRLARALEAAAVQAIQDGQRRVSRSRDTGRDREQPAETGAYRG